MSWYNLYSINLIYFEGLYFTFFMVIFGSYFPVINFQTLLVVTSRVRDLSVCLYFWLNMKSIAYGNSCHVTMISNIKLFESALFGYFIALLKKLPFFKCFSLYLLFCLSLLNYDTDYWRKSSILSYFLLFFCVYSFIYYFIYYFFLPDSTRMGVKIFSKTPKMF